jgi:hypothetical protein
MFIQGFEWTCRSGNGGGASCKVETWWMKVGKEGFLSQQDYSQEGAAPSSDPSNAKSRGPGKLHIPTSAKEDILIRPRYRCR